MATRASVVAGDGHTIGYEICAPTGPETPSTIVFLPALGVPLAYYARLFEVWTAEGQRVVGVEHRGPIAGIRSGRFGYSDMIRRDLPAVPRAVALLAKRAANAARMQIRVAGDVRVDHFSWARRAPADVTAPISRWLTGLADPSAA
jgi:predicted alpha/beta hydrolase